jgi:N,N'-diacetyllegionaminate synthase
MTGRIKIIAEIANSHEGKPARAIKTALEAVSIGSADYVKFQIYTADELLTVKHARYQHFKNQSFSREVWNNILSEMKKNNVLVLADIFGVESLECTDGHDIAGFKMHSSDLSNEILLRMTARRRKPVLLGVGGATHLEIKNALAILREYGDKTISIVLMHGFQAYPTSIEDTNLERLAYLKNAFGDRAEIGISDHIAGDDPFAEIIPLMAIPYGIHYIEKHITLDREQKGVDYYSALEPGSFKEFELKVRKAELSLGKKQISFPASEIEYRATVKKKWLFARDTTKGQVVHCDDLVFKRDDSSVSSLNYSEIINQELQKDTTAENLVQRSDFDNKVLAIVVARSASRRLPNKALMMINDEPSLSHLFNRLMESYRRGIITKIAFCTTTEVEDDALVAIASHFPILIYRGESDNVLSRMMRAIEDNTECNIILRITGDDILTDPHYMQIAIDYHLKNNLDYTDAKSIPSGMEVEVINRDVLELIHRFAKDPEGTEYLTNYIKDNASLFRTGSLPVEQEHAADLRLTLDTAEDYSVINGLCCWLAEKGRKHNYSITDVLEYFTLFKERATVNKKVVQKALPPSFSTDLDFSR